ncbi:MAG: hypothetical protein ABIN04_00245, partial [Ginsengibacter sp.]
VEAKLLVENNFLRLRPKFLAKEYVGDKGMNKYISGIYKQQGCMLGYIVEGKIEKIVEKINNEVIYFFDSNQILSKYTSSNFVHNGIYRSFHKEGLKYPMFHLMLDFN